MTESGQAPVPPAPDLASLVEGYKGTNEIRLAADAGELHGACWAWETLRTAWSKAIPAGEVNVVLQVTAKKIPELPNVPMSLDRTTPAAPFRPPHAAAVSSSRSAVGMALDLFVPMVSPSIVLAHEIDDRQEQGGRTRGGRPENGTGVHAPLVTDEC